MNADSTIQYNSLSWVKEQLDVVLGDAQRNLTDYIENEDDTDSLEQCINHLRLVGGTLQMVEVFGAAMLAEEMQKTAQAQLDGTADTAENVFDVLMRSMLQLPDYLEGLQAGNADSSIVLLPLMNDLRAARKESLLSESVLFLPNLNSVHIDGVDVDEGVAAGQLQNEAKRLRTHFQLGILDLIKHKKEQAGVQRMLAVVQSLVKSSSILSVKNFWASVAAFTEMSLGVQVDVGISEKELFGAVDRQLKILIDTDEDSFSNNIPEKLYKNILYYVGRSESERDSIVNVKKAFNLDEILQSSSLEDAANSGMGGINTELFVTVSEGIKEDLTKVKDVIEIFIHSADKDVNTLEALVEQLQRIGDTYGMLGLAESRTKTVKQSEVIASIVRGEKEVTEDLVLSIADELLAAESELNDYIAQRSGLVDSKLIAGEDNIVPAAEYRDVLTTVVKEALSNFTYAKEAILSFISGIGDKEQLATVINQLEEVRGITLMLTMPQLESQISELKNYVELALIDNNHIPNEEEQEAVADVVTCIEYFLESMVEGRLGVEAGLVAGDKAAEYLATAASHYVKQESTNEENESAELTTDNNTISDVVVNSTPDQVMPVVQPIVHTKSIEHEEFVILVDDADEEILEIFIEEAIEVLEAMNESYPQWKSDNDNDEALTIVRRSFHTLKGSGRLIGAHLIGEFAWKFENMLNRYIDKQISLSSHLFSCMDEALAVIPQLIEQLQGNREPISNIYQLMQTADTVSEGGVPEEYVVNNETVSESSEEIILTAEEPEVAEEVHEEVKVEDDVIDFSDMAIDSSADDSDAFDFSEMDNDIGVVTDDHTDVVEQLAGSTDEILDISNIDDDDILDLSEFTESDDAVEEVIIDAFNVSDADVGDKDSLDDVLAPTDDATNVDVEDVVSLDDFVLNETDIDIVDEIENETAVIEEVNSLASMDPVLFEIYYKESTDRIKFVEELLEQHDAGESKLCANKDLMRAFHTLYGSARTAEIEEIAELCGATEKYIKAKEESKDLTIPDEVVSIIKEVISETTLMIESIKAGNAIQSNLGLLDIVNLTVQNELQEQLEQSLNVESSTNETGDSIEIIESFDVDENLTPIIETAETGFSEQSANQESLEITESLPAESDSVRVQKTPESAASSNRSDIEIIQPAYGDIDEDLIDIFIEEAEELLESCDASILKLKNNSEDKEAMLVLQRDMHTFKGGARMAELKPIGDLTHVLESLLIELENNKLQANKRFFDILHESMDSLNVMMASVRSRSEIHFSTLLVKNVEALISGEEIEQRTVERFDIDIEDLNEEVVVSDADLASVEKSVSERDVVQIDEIEAVIEDKKPRWGERATDANYKESQDQVRVKADLLNSLVNSAGEVNIFHARMGKQITDIGFNLSELEQTVVRLKEQLRSMDIETEIQIRSTHESEADRYGEDFDPLEMDRYSNMQQLSRSLGETASDVQSIKDIIAEIVRDSETLLLQESRVSTELQEGLMRTRMVRFGGLSSRMRRIVRQTARELNKEVELDVFGDSIEVDRKVLDNIVAPLEHMLRNAVAHGIENSQDRISGGKDEVGKITLVIDRTGSEIIIKVTDDGAGINAKAVREKAISKGMIQSDSDLSDQEILQFILEAGFSTADNVSQIAGRGVGMDVVDTEIKQLGGLLEIETTVGKGTEFTITLPVTLAINQALLVSANEDMYAIPLSSIEGVVRVTGVVLQSFYDSDQTMYEFNGIEYELKHMGNLMAGRQMNYADQHQLFPVLLAKVGDHNFALHVDDLIERREVVVKPIGLQLGMVRGISGATILADGRVVLIVEMAALVVGDTLIRSADNVDVTEQVVIEDHEKVIMIVDDSITIRKVTSRMLERNGISVVMAKDGVDATHQLQETIPDLMLLDIEMPRMDGFELATYMRNDNRLKDIPIIMITSRTGDKHKEKAFDIGVNKFLGKPYQEDELMQNINEIFNA